MLTRGTLALGASALAGLAAVIASLDGEPDIVPFFVGLTFLGGLGAWAVREPFVGRRVFAGRAIAALWLGAAIWVGALLVLYQATCGCSYPPRPPEATYLASRRRSTTWWVGISAGR